MPMTDVGKNLQLDALTGTNPTTPVTHAAFHTAYPGADGQSNEVAGGSYARQAIAFAAASGGAKAATGLPTAFSIPGGTTVKFVSLKSAVTAGVALAFGAIGSGGLVHRYRVDLAADTFNAPAHGFVNDNLVVFMGGAAPSPLLADGTEYWIVNASTDSFQVALTQGGAAVNITTVGDLDTEISRIIPETFGGDGTLNLNAADLNLNA